MTGVDEIYAEFQRYSVVPKSHYVGTLQLAGYVNEQIEAKRLYGSIVECGVWRGGMIAGMAKVLGPELDYVLADSFEGLPNPTEDDGPRTKTWFEINGRMDNAPEHYAIQAMKRAKVPEEHVHVVKGWFNQTLPHTPLPHGIALLRLDADFFESTVDCLDILFPCVNDGGLIIVDDYYFLDGAAKAVHQYLSDWGRTERIETHGDWRTNEGVAFIRKGRNWT